MKVGELVAKFAAKSGINLADEKNKDLATALSAIATEIPDEQANRISGSLFNMDDAKNNLDLKKHFTAAVYDGMDSEINSLMDEMGFELQDKEIVKAEQSTTKKQAALARQIKALEEKKSAAKGSQKSDLEKQINEKIAQIAANQKAFDEEKKQIKADYEQRLTAKEIRSMLNGKKYANKDVPLEVNVETALVIANRKLAESGAKIVNINDALVLKQAASPEQDWLSPTNEKLTVEQFFDGVLASAKMYAVTDAPPAGGGNPNPLPIPGGGNGNANPSIMYSMQEDLKAVEAIPN